MRGLRRLRPEVALPVGAPGRDRVRPQDADPPGLLQQGLLVPRGRLPVVPHRRARQEGEARDAGARRRSCPSRAGSWPTRRLRRAHDGHRRHRRRDREPGARHGRADRRPARVRPRPDRPLAEGRPGRLRPAHHARAARGRQQGAGRQRGPLPRLRPARRGERQEPRCGGSASGRWRSCPRSAVPDRADGHRLDERFPELARAARQDRRRHPQRAQPLRGRAAPLRAALRRPHDGQHAGPRRGLPARAPAGLRRGDRARDRAERRRRREEPRRAALGPRGGRRARRRRGAPRARRRPSRPCAS